MNIIIYHKNCADGTMAAAVALQAIRGQTMLVPMQYGDSVKEACAAAHKLPFNEGVKDDLSSLDGICIVDFSLPPADLDEVATWCNKVVVLDHHKSAIEKLAGYKNSKVQLFLVESMSGAMLTWEFFHAPTETAPDAVRYVQDRDLWTWALPNSKEVAAAFAMLPHDPRLWADVALKSFNLGKVVAMGRTILTYQQKIIDGAVKNFRARRVGEDTYWCLNSTTLVSEIGSAFLEANPGIPICCIYFINDEKDEVVFSFRSNTGLAKEAAEKLGGGGHPNAAGGRMSITDWATYRSKA